MEHPARLLTPPAGGGAENRLQRVGRYDPEQARQSLRRGRERGVWVFIPAAELRKADVDPDGPAPRYRLWGRRSGSVLVRLYRNSAG